MPDANMTASKESGGIVCVGNLIVDRVHTLTYWPDEGNLAHITHQTAGVGGGAVNVACDLASLGLPARVSLAGLVGRDADAAFLLDQVWKKGVNTAAVQSLSDASTGHTHVMTVPGKSRTFFYHGGANDRLNLSSIEVGSFATAGYRLFYLGYLMLLPGLDALDADGRSGASRLLEKAKRAGLQTAVDFVSSEDPAFAAQVRSSLAWCDHIIINEIEAGQATGLSLRTPEGPLDMVAMQRAADLLFEFGVRQNVIIHAPELSIWKTIGQDMVITCARSVASDDIVSPVGAGDAFCSAVLFGLHQEWSPSKTAALAHRAAAHCLRGATATDGIPSMAMLQREDAAENAENPSAEERV